MIYVTNIHVNIGIYTYIYKYIRSVLHFGIFRIAFITELFLDQKLLYYMSRDEPRLVDIEKGLSESLWRFFGLQYPYTPQKTLKT